MRKQIAAAALAASLMGGGAGIALFGPSPAGAQATTESTAEAADGTTSTTTARPDPSAWMADALQELVGAGTITSDQATAVTSALAEARPAGGGPGGGFRRGGGGVELEAAATAIGVEETALRDALASGQTIAEVAAANGVDRQAVVDAMVAALDARLAEDVSSGRLTQEEADERRADAAERIAARVDGQLPVGGPPPVGLPPEGADDQGTDDDSAESATAA